MYKFIYFRMLSLAVLKSVPFFLAQVKTYINRDAILNGDALWSLWRYVNQLSNYLNSSSDLIIFPPLFPGLVMRFSLLSAII